MNKAIALISTLFAGFSAMAADIHVSPAGNNDNDGTIGKPLKTISAAAEKVMPGDTVVVHAGMYRERVDPPRGGESNAKRIVYAAAPGEKVVITGSDQFKTWEKVSGDIWKLVVPNSYFGKFNPYAEKVWGDWFNGQGRTHSLGNVYLNGEWLAEATSVDAVQKSSDAQPMWYSTVDGLAAVGPEFLMNIASLKPVAGSLVAASNAAERSGPRNAPCSEGGDCVGFIAHGSWVRYDNVDFETGTESIEIRAAAEANTGGIIELREGHFDGGLLGTCEIKPTGDWQKWQNFSAKIKKTEGKKNLYLVFKSAAKAKAESTVDAADKKTTIHARFPGVNPNEGAVEVCVRPTVFTAKKTNIDYITVRGFELRNAGTNWAAPTMGQHGLVTAYWSKGWIIENNEICYSRCSGIALGKNSDQWDGKRGNTEGYYLTIDDALKKDGWSKDKIGSHIVRNNHIHHCGQTGIVGSLGCAFSRIENNEIHDINLQGIWGGAEMGGIKFHGAIDVVISGNHIYRCGMNAGIWLDWMAQGTQITNNLLHDNPNSDLFMEVNHGPFLVANNLFLSPSMEAYSWGGSQGGAYAHNLIAGRLCKFGPDGRRTPVMKPHSTEQVALETNPVGDVRYYSNVFANREKFVAYDEATLPCTMSGNVFANGAEASRFDTASVSAPAFDAGVKLTKNADGWYLTMASDAAWRTAQKRPLVTTELLGNAKIPNQGFTHPDGSPLKVDADYFGKNRDVANPFPGPFEAPVNGEVKVWPKNN